MFLLDTDSFSLFLRGTEPLRTRVLSTPPEQVFISAVTVEETLRGRLQVVAEEREKHARGRRNRLPDAYRGLNRLLEDLRLFAVLPYDERADACFQAIPSGVRRVGSQDCRIAAVALARGLTVVTANVRDFERIPGVRLEDWTLLPETS